MRNVDSPQFWIDFINKAKMSKKFDTHLHSPPNRIKWSTPTPKQYNI